MNKQEREPIGIIFEDGMVAPYVERSIDWDAMHKHMAKQIIKSIDDTLSGKLKTTSKPQPLRKNKYFMGLPVRHSVKIL